MRLLAEENLPLATIESLGQAGHDVSRVRTDYPGAKDTWRLELAEAQERILFTLDKDLWQIAIQKRTPLDRSGVILFRVHPAISQAHCAACAEGAGYRAGVERTGLRCNLGSRTHGAIVREGAGSIGLPLLALVDLASNAS
jgi:hypothetical protein